MCIFDLSPFILGFRNNLKVNSLLVPEKKKGKSLRLRLEVGFQLEELHWIMNAKADWKWKWITMPMLLFGCICNG